MNEPAMNSVARLSHLLFPRSAPIKMRNKNPLTMLRNSIGESLVINNIFGAEKHKTNHGKESFQSIKLPLWLLILTVQQQKPWALQVRFKSSDK
jgi:hypothetical protein